MKNRKILSNVRRTYTTEKGGIIPLKAKEHHENWYNDVKSGKVAAKSGAAPQIQH